MKTTLLAIVAVFGVFLAGCSQEAQKDAAAAGDAAGTAVSKGGEAVATDVNKAGEAAVNAGEAAVDATKNGVEAVADATMTPKVKNALLSASGLDASKINVETMGNTIMLKGSVPDEKQKNQAGAAAKAIAGGEFTVKNELTIGM